MKKNGLKRLIAGLTAVCTAVSALSVTAFAAETVTSAVVGDANCDGSVDFSDVVLIMQALANPSKYAPGGTDSLAMSAQGWINADCNGRNDGVSNDDALAIQMYLLGKGTLDSGKENPVTDATKIHLRNTSITVEGENAVVEGTTVTITHSGEYYIDGTLYDGQININVPDEAADPDTVKIFLSGVSITGKNAPAILVTNAENTSINIADGTVNTITDGDTAYSGEHLESAVIEAKDDLTVKGGEKGDGILNITANTQGAVSCNNDIKINGGVINVAALNSADETNGIKGKKSVTVKGGMITVEAEGDGIKSSKGAVSFSGGTTVIKAGNDAVQAETTIDISGGDINAGGDRGLTAVTGINITGGNVVATATDNQTDKTLISSEQAVVLFNCIDDSSSKDGTWKKANSFSLPVTPESIRSFTKKYRYVLLSGSLAEFDTVTFGFTNSSTGARITHSADASDIFEVNGLTAEFDNVNPAGKSADPSPVPE